MTVIHGDVQWSPHTNNTTDEAEEGKEGESGGGGISFQKTMSPNKLIIQRYSMKLPIAN